MLINEKREEFATKLDDLHEKEVLRQKAELSPPSDESENSDVNESSEVVEDSEKIEKSEKEKHSGEHPVVIVDTPQKTTHIPTCCGPVTNKGLKKDSTEVVPDAPIVKTPVITKQLIPTRVGDLVRVKEQLDALLDKQAEFVGKYHAHKARYPDDTQKLLGFENAIKATGSIYDNINYLYNAYIYGDIDLDHFKQAAEPLLGDEVEEVQTLKSHRGFKEIADIVANLLILIGTAGTVHVAAALYKGKFEFGLFKSATKSGVIVDNLDNEISHVAAASA